MYNIIIMTIHTVVIIVVVVILAAAILPSDGSRQQQRRPWSWQHVQQGSLHRNGILSHVCRLKFACRGTNTPRTTIQVQNIASDQAI